MAEIYRGFTYDEDGFRLDVAIKKLLPHFLEDTQFIDMLTDEFKLVSQLRHPNIAEVYELTEVNGSLLIAMEYVDGKDLRSTFESLLQSGAAYLEFDHIAYIMARALDGLHHAHIARDFRGELLQIVHRDFSPSNVLVGYDGAVKLIDFGIAKARQNRVQTKTGIIKGKVKYMSPEQAFGKRLDCRSDIFSAGSVLYELCTGKAPFDAKNEIDLIFAVRDADPTPSREVNPSVPEELDEIIRKSMARSRSARFQSAMEFRDALLDFLRAYNSNYSRSRLSRLMKTLWSKEIEHELRQMEEFVADQSTEDNFGKNLIADVLGPDAAFARFNPNATQHTDLEAPMLTEAEEAQARTILLDSNDVRAQEERTTQIPIDAFDDALDSHPDFPLADEKTVRTS